MGLLHWRFQSAKSYVDYIRRVPTRVVEAEVKAWISRLPADEIEATEQQLAEVRIACPPWIGVGAARPACTRSLSARP